MKSVELIERGEIQRLASTMDIYDIVAKYIPEGRDADRCADEIVEYIGSLEDIADTVISTEWLSSKIQATPNETRRRAFNEVVKEILGQ